MRPDERKGSCIMTGILPPNHAIDRISGWTVYSNQWLCKLAFAGPQVVHYCSRVPTLVAYGALIGDVAQLLKQINTRRSEVVCTPRNVSLEYVCFGGGMAVMIVVGGTRFIITERIPFETALPTGLHRCCRSRQTPIDVTTVLAAGVRWNP